MAATGPCGKSGIFATSTIDKTGIEYLEGSQQNMENFIHDYYRNWSFASIRKGW